MSNKGLIGTLGSLAIGGVVAYNTFADPLSISSIQRRVPETNDFGVVSYFDNISVTNTVQDKTYSLQGVEKLGSTNNLNLNYQWKSLGSEVASTNNLNFKVASPTTDSYFYRVEEKQ